MIILRTGVNLRAEEFNKLRYAIIKQAQDTGIIVLPWHMELVYQGENEEIEVKPQEHENINKYGELIDEHCTDMEEIHLG